jgi:hypothetical protein
MHRMMQHINHSSFIHSFILNTLQHMGLLMLAACLVMNHSMFGQGLATACRCSQRTKYAGAQRHSTGTMSTMMLLPLLRLSSCRLTAPQISAIMYHASTEQL